MNGRLGHPLATSLTGGHTAITAYDSASILGSGPMDRWQQETSRQGPWNGISAIEMKNALDVEEVVAGGQDRDETIVGTSWWS